MLWLHIVAATVWIGGQITLGVLVPVLRRQPVILRDAALRFQWPAWTAFAVLVLTGLINMHNASIPTAHLTDTPRGRTLSLKLVFVLISGLAAAGHAHVVAPRAGRSRSSGARAASGVLGALSLMAALAAALYGVLIAER